MLNPDIVNLTKYTAKFQMPVKKCSAEVECCLCSSLYFTTRETPRALCVWGDRSTGPVVGIAHDYRKECVNRGYQLSVAERTKKMEVASLPRSA